MAETKEIAGKTYEESDSIKQLAESVIAKRNLNLNGARVRYVECSPKISKTTAATCRKAGIYTSFFGDCDYIVTVSSELWKLLTDDIKEKLIYHELLHINPKITKKGDVKFALRDHNVKDFRVIIEESGIDWCNQMFDEMLKTLDEKEKMTFDDMRW